MRLAVACAENEIVGYVLGISHPAFYANGDVAWVEEIMVREDHRGQGVGKRLMDDFEAWALSRQCRLVSLATRRAADFYRAIGYVETAAYFRKELGA
jgi:GNAT superfamily N-acetyltransferase